MSQLTDPAPGAPSVGAAAIARFLRPVASLPQRTNGNR
jgi:hypothetical protein